jgi:hypothetical protein
MMTSANLDLVRSIYAAWERDPVKTVQPATRITRWRKQYSSGGAGHSPMPEESTTPDLVELRTYAGRSYVTHVESSDRPAIVPLDQEVRDGLHGEPG